MTDLDLALSLFNVNVFQQAKNNITELQYYFDTNGATCGNRLISELVNAIKDYSFDQIDLPLFNSIMARCGKTPAEGTKIINDIVRWKSYDKKQMEPSKKFIDDIVANSIITRANKLYQEHPSEYLKYLKNINYKTSSKDIFSTTNFKNLDINSVINQQMSDGVSSSFDFINQSFRPFCKYEMGQIGLISMPPGCFVGSTKIYTSEGINTIEELCGKTNIEVYSFNGTEKVKSVAEKCIKTKEVTDLIEIQTNDGGIIRSTEDHRFLLSDKNYKEAKDINIGDELMSFSDSYLNIVVVSKKKINLEKPESVYDLVNVGLYSNFAIMTSENTGIFVHNCGKTMWAFAEALHMAIEGKKVLYTALGDIGVADFITRMCAIYSGLPFWKVKENLGAIYNGICQILGDRLDISIEPAGTVTVDDYIEYVEDKDYEVLFIDYDSNFKSNVANENMYLVYGEIYDKLTKLSLAGKLVFILSQPQKFVWKNEIIDMSEIGESARKAACSDFIITRGRVAGNPNHLGKFKIAKNRRGEEGYEVGSIRLNNGRFIILPDEVYEQLKRETTKRDYTEADINAMIAQYNRIHTNINRQINQAAQQYGGGQPISGPTPFGRP